MNKIFFTSTILCGFICFADSANAQNCPVLSGDFVCAPHGSAPYRVSVQTYQQGPNTAYQFNSAAEGQRQIIADGAPQGLQSAMGKGTYSARCEGGQLQVTFMLVTSDGRNYHLTDTIRVERKALVRIRLSLPSSQIPVKEVYVCRPYFPPRR